MNKELPEMIVEKRNSTTAHRVPAPNTDPEFLAGQIQDALQLNNDAKVYEFRELLMAEVHKRMEPLAWKKTTTDILIKNLKPFVSDITREEIIKSVKDVFGLNGFDELARWVQDDMCSEVFNRMLKYCLKEGQPHKREKGFVDGSGIGYLNLFRKNLKVNIEKTFDTKWFYKVERPLEYIQKTYGMDLSLLANKIHPGHWSYVQGHQTKSLTAVQTCRECFNLDSKCDRALFIAGMLFGAGRDGNLIHIWPDSANAGYNTELEEFKA